ncbi:MAG: hypothetical protein ABI142_11050, partial [Bryocella sp.]
SLQYRSNASMSDSAWWRQWRFSRLSKDDTLVNTRRLQGIYPSSLEMIGACVPLTTNIGLLLNSLRQDSEWRDRAGFNGHPDLIPAVNLLMQ